MNDLVGEQNQRNAPIESFELRAALRNDLRAFVIQRNPGTTLLLTGPSGSGKTQIMNYLAREIRQAEPGRVIIAISVATMTGDQFVYESFKQITQHFDRPDVKAKLKRTDSEIKETFENIAKGVLKDVAKRYLPVGEHTFAALADLMINSPLPGTGGAPRAIDDRIPVFKNFLTAVLDIAPVAFVIDGLEHAEPTIVSAIRSIDQAIYTNPGSLLAISNNDDHGPGYLAQLEPYLSRRNLSVRSIPRLSADELRDWASNAGIILTIDEAQRAVDRCDGRPVYLAQWLRGSDLPTVAGQLRQNLGSVITARLNQLPDDDQAFLMKLSLLPSTARVPSAIASRLFFGTVTEAAVSIARLRDQGFLSRTPDEVGFSNELLRERIYDRVDAGVREEFARELIQKSANIGTRLDPFWNLALTKSSGDPEALIDQAMPAARLFVEQGRPKLATETYTLVQEELGKQPDIRLASLLLGKAEALHDQGRYEDALVELSTLEKLQPADRQKAEMHRWIATNAMRLGRYRLAREHLRFFRSVMNGRETLDLLRIQNTIERDLGDYTDALATARKILAIERSTVLSPRDRNRAYRSLARTYALAGPRDQALDFGNKAVAMASEIEIRELGNSWLASAEAHRHAGKEFEAIKLYDQAVTLGRDCGNPDSVIWALLGLADAHLLNNTLDSSDRTLGEIPAWMNITERDQPLEQVHYRFSLHVNAIIRGSDSIEMDETILGMYSRLGVEWPANYLELIRRQRRATRPKTL